jgi:hypothetical protein
MSSTEIQTMLGRSSTLGRELAEKRGRQRRRLIMR